MTSLKIKSKKPVRSYVFMNKKRLNGFKLTELISEAIISSKDKIMEVEEIYEYILQKLPKLALEKSSTNWKRNIRNMLKLENKMFEKVGFSCWSLKTTPTNDSILNISQTTRTAVIEPTSNSHESKSEP